MDRLSLVQYHTSFKHKFFITFFTLYLIANFVNGQIIISGTVYDSTKLYSITGVEVKSTGGDMGLTDSAGIYQISVTEADSISFYYRNKSTIKFPVKAITNYNEFDISLQVRVQEKYKPLKPVYIFSNYHKDSAEKRITYSKIFNYDKPGIRSTYTPGSSAGLDINELINIFRFRKNKQTLQFQKRLIQQEQDSYIDYRFNSTLLKRITGLNGLMLEKYRSEYRPSFEFLTSISEVEFYEYVITTSRKFKSENGLE